MDEELTAYQKWEREKIEDIGHDTDALLKMIGGKEMSESYDSGMLAGLLSRQGVDRTVVNEANYLRMLDAIGGNRSQKYTVR